MGRKIDFSKYPPEVKLAAHAIGLDYKRPYQKRGKFFFRAYRNSIWVNTDAIYQPILSGLVSTGYMGAYHTGGSMCCRLTRAGIAWLEDLFNITILVEDGGL